MEPVRLPASVLVANRGEIAVRILRTCRELGIGTVAVYSDPDVDAWHVELADEAVRIGSAAPSASYLRGDAIIEAARRTGAQAVHPGYGFLSESADFARQVLDAGLTWVGPPPEVIAAMGDKIAAKARMVAAGVPVVSGAELPADLDARTVATRAAEVGYPLLVKAAAGGGGKGMRLVADSDSLAEAVAAARREAGSAFGDDRVFLERFVPRPRHLEVQILADAHGHVVHLFERECSIQRRHQKVIEEAPSVAIDGGVRDALTAAAVDAARAIGYVNAGTVEFVADEAVLARRRRGEDVDPREAFAFLEVNTRLQVEHPVTEQTVRARDRSTDPLDLVHLQLRVAAGGTLPFAQDDLVQVGHAIEARLYAEDPAQGHRPAPGPLARFAPAEQGGVRWDAGVRAGDVITADYDPMLAKVIGTGSDRFEAAARLAAALESTLLSATTNRDLLVGILRDDAFLAGDTTTGFLEGRVDALLHGGRAVRDDLVDAVAAVTFLHTVLQPGPAAVTPVGVPPRFANTRPLPVTGTAAVADTPARAVRLEPVGRDRCRWQATMAVGASADTWQDGLEELTNLELVVHDAGPEHLDVEVEGHRRRVRVCAASPAHDETADAAFHVRIGRRWLPVILHARFPLAASAAPEGATTAPMPGTVTSVPVAAGDAVTTGTLLATIEAMKMEHRVTATVDGTIAKVQVVAGQQVDADQVLMVVVAD